MRTIFVGFLCVILLVIVTVIWGFVAAALSGSHAISPKVALLSPWYFLIILLCICGEVWWFWLRPHH